MMPRRFYGPPTNCSDLSKLGYTLNGFYQVKSNFSAVNDSSNDDDVDTSNVETIYCAFKQPDGTFNSSNIETRSSKFIVSPINNSRNRSGGGAHFHFMSHRGYFYPFPKNYTQTDFLEVKIPEKVLNLLEEGYFNESNSTFTAPKIGVYQFFFIGSMRCRIGMIHRQETICAISILTRTLRSLDMLCIIYLLSTVLTQRRI